MLLTRLIYLLFFLSLGLISFSEPRVLTPGHYRILQGEVVYRASTALSTWSGRNNTISGSFSWGEDGKLEGRICVDQSAWDSGNPLRDAHTRRMFEVDRYPFACFLPSAILLQGEKVDLEGKLDLHGKTRPWSLSGNYSEETASRASLHLLGQVNLKAWDLKPPRLLSLEVNDRVEVSVSVRIERIK